MQPGLEAPRRGRALSYRENQALTKTRGKARARPGGPALRRGCEAREAHVASTRWPTVR